MKRTATTLIALSLVLAACGSGGADASDSIDGSWILETIDTGGSSTPVLAGTEPSLEFSGDSVSGSDGCNRISGSFSTGTDGSIAIGPLAQTMMACEGPVMSQADLVVGILDGATGYEVGGGTLTLTADDGRRLVYRGA